MRFLVFLMPVLIIAGNLHISVNKTKILPNEEVIITLSAKGKNIIFPNPDKIAGYPVLGTSINNNIMVINGEVKESVSKTFVIAPDKNITVPSFKVKIDGKIFTTKPIKIEVTSPKQTKGDYELELNISKKSLYIGESAILSIKFIKQKDIDSVQIQNPANENFYLKEISKTNLANGVEYKFLLIPLKSGTFNIGPIYAKIGHQVKEKLFGDPFFTMTSMKYETIYSNKLNINVKPIPKNTIFGDFNLKVKAKKEVLANKPNTATLKLTGCGDFINMKEFKLKIKNASVYPDKPKINTFIKNNKLCGTLEQNFTIISDTNYTIPSITLNEFDSKKIKTLTTLPIKVNVINSNKTSPTPKINKKPLETSNKNHYYLIAFLGGLLSGSIITFIILRFKREKDIYSQIKSAKEKELFKILLSYKDYPEIKNILEKLEENIYNNANHKIDKKEIIKILKRLNSN
jgi:hypothetical protein